MQDDVDMAAAALHDARAVLFDFNGTLSLDEDLLEAAYGAALVRMGETPLAPGEYAALLGRSEYDICAALLAARPATPSPAFPSSAPAPLSPAPSSPAELLGEVTRSYLETCAAHCPVPASHQELVAGLVAEGVRCAVVTGTIPQMVTPVLTQAGLSGLLSCLVTADDIARGKPSPEGFLLARSRMGLGERDTVVVLEDSQAGVTAAVQAGMVPIAVQPGLVGAAMTLPSLAALAEVWAASPGVHAHAHHV